MIEKYYLFENLQQARKILRDLNIEENTKKFQDLRNLVGHNLGNLGIFTKWLFEDRESFDTFKEVYDYMKTIPNLDKKPDEFEKMEDFLNYLQNFESNRIAHQIIKVLPISNQRSVTSELKELIRTNLDVKEGIISFFRNKGSRSIYSDSAKLYEATKKKIKELKEFNPEKVREKAKKVGVKLIVDTDDIIMADITTYEQSKQLGTEDWCISTIPSMFTQYVNSFTKQYFIWDFTKDVDDNKRMIGATISPKNIITSAHWADDKPVQDLTYFDNL